ncbi:MAG: hypothetical protein AAF223_00970 [Bacteroidota bacterium]
MILLGWFSISSETFLRRDFGERYYSKANFIVGLLFMLAFLAVGSVLGDWTGKAAAFFRFAQTGEDSVFKFVISGYILFGLGHRLKIWGRAASGTRLHTIQSGHSWLQRPVAVLVLPLFNLLLKLGIKLLEFTFILRLILSEEQRGAILHSKPITSEREFTQRYVEPFLLLVLAGVSFLYGAGITGSWLLWSAFSVVILSAMRFDAEYQREMDEYDIGLEVELPQAALGKSDRVQVSERRKRIWRKQSKELADRKDREEMKRIKEMQPVMAKVYAVLDPTVAAMMDEVEQEQPPA